MGLLTLETQPWNTDRSLYKHCLLSKIYVAMILSTQESHCFIGTILPHSELANWCKNIIIILARYLRLALTSKPEACPTPKVNLPAPWSDPLNITALGAFSDTIHEGI
jgi:hypothetical protein